MESKVVEARSWWKTCPVSWLVDCNVLEKNFKVFRLLVRSWWRCYRFLHSSAAEKKNRNRLIVSFPIREANDREGRKSDGKWLILFATIWQRRRSISNGSEYLRNRQMFSLCFASWLVHWLLHSTPSVCLFSFYVAWCVSLLLLPSGLMISALAKAGAILNDKTYIDRAINAARFMRAHLYDRDSGRLLRSCYRSASDDGPSQK